MMLDCICCEISMFYTGLIRSEIATGMLCNTDCVIMFSEIRSSGYIHFVSDVVLVHMVSFFI